MRTLAALVVLLAGCPYPVPVPDAAPAPDAAVPAQRGAYEGCQSGEQCPAGYECLYPDLAETGGDGPRFCSARCDNGEQCPGAARCITHPDGRRYCHQSCADAGVQCPAGTACLGTGESFCSPPL